MKGLMLSVLTLMTSSMAMGRELNPDEALSAALQRLLMTQSQTKARRAASKGASAMKLTFTRQSDDKKPLFYVYDLTGGGYVIAAADDRAHSLLGYTDEGSFLDEAQIPGFAQWQQQCAEAMEWLSCQPEWPAMAQKRETEGLTPVAPLLGEIMWNQLYPYNAMCPYRTNAKGEQVQASTGCVATATAQIMMYHQWPQSGTGSNTNMYDRTQTVDFSQSTYDWTNLKATYTGQESAEEAAPIAKLMYDIGCAENMNYEATGSSSADLNAMVALATYFKYDKGITAMTRTHYATEQWNQTLREELCQQRPICVSADPSIGIGHAFVIDGFDVNGLYHVNWGWGGNKNGYFDMDYLDSDMPGVNCGGDHSFNVSQIAIVNIRRDETGTSQAQTRLQVSTPLHYDTVYECLSYSLVNYGLEKFTGYAGFQLQNQMGEVVDEYRKDLSGEKIGFCVATEIYYRIPEELRDTEGLIARPIYGEGETLFYLDSHPLSVANRLVSYDTGNGIAWMAYQDDEPQLLLNDWKVIRNYVGYSPKIQLTIANLASSQVEFNNTVQICISNDEKDLCFGQTQLFLQPGQTKTIEVNCEYLLEGIEADLEAGDYVFLPFYSVVSQYRYLHYGPEMSEFKGAGFTMVENAPSDISYSDFAIDKTLVVQGDTLTASFTADNAGGYTIEDYYFVLFHEGEIRSCGRIRKLGNDIAPYSQTQISISGPINLDPGPYFGAFYDSQHRITEKFHFTVAEKMDPTIAVTPSADSESHSAALYDLFGRRIGSAARHGIYVVEGKKIFK